jgi:hypothetical protein
MTRSKTLFLVLLAAAGTFALTMGARQSMGLFVSTLNTTPASAWPASAWRLRSASCGGA